MDSYAYSEFIGPDGFFPGDDFLMGLLLLGPDRLYKDHAASGTGTLLDADRPFTLAPRSWRV